MGLLRCFCGLVMLLNRSLAFNSSCVTHMSAKIVKTKFANLVASRAAAWLDEIRKTSFPCDALAPKSGLASPRASPTEEKMLNCVQGLASRKSRASFGKQLTCTMHLCLHLINLIARFNCVVVGVVKTVSAIVSPHFHLAVESSN